MPPERALAPPIGGGAGARGQSGARPGVEATSRPGCPRCAAQANDDLLPLDYYLSRDGDVLLVGPGFKWKAYDAEGGLAAVCYVGGHRLFRDRDGWWVATFRGDKRRVTGDVVGRLAGTAPEGWPVLVEQAELLAPPAEVGRDAA